jgi:type IV secretion system protein VirB6/type IV secretion system protein TrbL
MVWTFGMMALRKADIGEFFAELVRFTIFTGFFWWLLTNGPNFASTIYASLRQLAGNATGLGQALSPSGIVDMGFAIFYKVMDQSSVWSPVDSMAGILMAVAILIVLALIGVNMLLLLASGWVLAYGGVFFLGFGGSRWTSDMAINYYKTVLGVAAQLMAMVLLVGIGKTFLDDYYAHERGISLKEMGVMLIVCVILLALVNKIPPLIAGVITGASVGGAGIGNFGAGAALGAAGMAASSAATGGAALAAGAASAAGGASAVMAAFSKANENVSSGSDVMSMLGGGGGGDSGGGGGGGAPAARPRQAAGFGGGGGDSAAAAAAAASRRAATRAAIRPAARRVAKAAARRPAAGDAAARRPAKVAAGQGSGAGRPAGRTGQHRPRLAGLGRFRARHGRPRHGRRRRELGEGNRRCCQGRRDARLGAERIADTTGGKIAAAIKAQGSGTADEHRRARPAARAELRRQQPGRSRQRCRSRVRSSRVRQPRARPRRQTA